MNSQENKIKISNNGHTFTIKGKDIQMEKFLKVHKVENFGTYVIILLTDDVPFEWRTESDINKKKTYFWIFMCFYVNLTCI